MKTNINTIPQKIRLGAAFILCLLLLNFVTAKADTIKVQPAEKAKQADIWTFIAKHRWNLIQLNGKTVQKAQPFLQFDINKGRINGNSGCNSIFGPFERTASTISFKQLASTMMACLDQEANKMEREFNQTITGKRFTFDVADQTLNLYQDGKIVLMFGMAR